jgi:hypothetical protein
MSVPFWRTLVAELCLQKLEEVPDIPRTLGFCLSFVPRLDDSLQLGCFHGLVPTTVGRPLSSTTQVIPNRSFDVTPSCWAILRLETLRSLSACMAMTSSLVRRLPMILSSCRRTRRGSGKASGRGRCGRAGVLEQLMALLRAHPFKAGPRRLSAEDHPRGDGRPR